MKRLVKMKWLKMGHSTLIGAIMKAGMISNPPCDRFGFRMQIPILASKNV